MPDDLTEIFEGWDCAEEEHRHPAAVVGSPLLHDMAALFREIWERYKMRDDIFTGHALDMKRLLYRYDNGER
ncbi:MAG: hypothetical protein HGB26_01455 [Desulfobulbaceae bacterium]|nr:hypothetical protein [Desulfobulbaceae bacterium]